MAAKHTFIVVAVTACAIAGLVAVNTIMQKIKQPTVAPVAASTGPIEFVDFDEPIKAIAFVNGQKGPKRGLALAQVVGKYIAAPGWDGTITAVTNESGGRVALRLQYLSSMVIGGEYWVVAIVGKNHGVKAGDPVRVSGRIKDVVFKAGSASVTQSVILEDATVIKQ